MKTRKKDGSSSLEQPWPLSGAGLHGRLVSAPEEDQYLDSVELSRLEESFRAWSRATPRRDVQLSRRRILIVFLLIRYSAAKLNEVLALNPFEDIDFDRHTVIFRNNGLETDLSSREVQISEKLSREIREALADPAFRSSLHHLFEADPGFVRRKFYERAEDCGFAKHRGGPEMIRKSRAVELMQGNMPLPAVQMMLGHSTPNLTSAYVSFSEDEIRQVMKVFLERESSRKTSARNSFFGKVREIIQGDIQSRVELTTISGHTVATVITNDSLARLGLKKGRLITAEVKAPWVILERGDDEPLSSAENRFSGLITSIKRGQVNTEYTVRISDGTELCALVTTASGRRLGLSPGDGVWAMFNCFAVVLHVD
jgi:molybdate transport system regulatory protein